MKVFRFATPLLASLALLSANLHAADNIKVGVLTTLSGPASAPGIDQRDAINLAMKLLGNKLGGLPAELITVDDQFSPDAAKQAADRLLRRDKIDVLTGVIYSNVLLAVVPSAVANKIEPWQPASQSVPVVWRYQALRAHVLRSLDLVTPEKAGRRVIYLNNPGRRDVSAAVGWLYAGLQVMNPGEVASSHRHSASAIRFIMEGTGAYTVVDGHKMTLGANDFVLTPNGTWHEHAVAPEGTPCIWQDGLDIPFVNAMEANFYEVHPDLSQAVTYPVDDMTKTWGNPGLTPGSGNWTRGYSPMFKYEWLPTYDALTKYASCSDGSPFDGVLMEYVNPATNGPVMRTLGASMQLLRPGEHTQAHRHTGSFLYHVAKGRGHSIINGQRYDWQERDILGLARACQCVSQ